MTQPSTRKSFQFMKMSNALRIVQCTGCIAAVGLGGLLTVTNPKQEHYTEFATRTVSKFLVKDLCRANSQSPKLFDTWIQDGCQTFMNRGETEIRSFIQHNTERQDFVLFSLYTTDFPIRPLRVLGLFNQFFLI